MSGFFQSLGEFLLATGPAVHGVTWAALAVVLAAAVGLPCGRSSAAGSAGKRPREEKACTRLS